MTSDVHHRRCRGGLLDDARRSRTLLAAHDRIERDAQFRDDRVQRAHGWFRLAALELGDEARRQAETLGQLALAQAGAFAFLAQTLSYRIERLGNIRLARPCHINIQPPSMWRFSPFIAGFSSKNTVAPTTSAIVASLFVGVRAMVASRAAWFPSQ